jgi:hypothetical protein
MSGWRTLAEPTYGIAGDGQAMKLAAGTEIQLANAVQPNGSVEVVARPEGGTNDFGMYIDVTVTASALRFDDDGFVSVLDEPEQPKRPRVQPCGRCGDTAPGSCTDGACPGPELIFDDDDPAAVSLMGRDVL